MAVSKTQLYKMRTQRENDMFDRAARQRVVSYQRNDPHFSGGTDEHDAPVDEEYEDQEEMWWL